MGRPSLETDAVIERNEPTGWLGWLLFAGVMLILLGTFQAMLGLVALFNDDFFVAHRNGQLVLTDYTTWGWIHLLLAVIAFSTGLGLMFGQLWARISGVILCVANVLISLAFLGAYPWWAAMLIAFSVITAYAIIAHGRELGEVLDI
ncbi:MAG: hypothetical protein AUI14_08780 [Actinobacteria bacterium 13_2_20CM_2_71_6]|nr:MAG: hypothetical protein AUI14_08780 [Actinobacteria bacterium 13_2_20CM_2_71_6]